MKHQFWMTAAALLIVASHAGAQVKDSHGDELRVGKPIRPTQDYNGGTVSRGRLAKCVLDAEEDQVCTFFPRNGNGSFAIDVDGLAYYADKTSTNRISVDYDNGARMVPQGTYIRSSRDPACWLQGSKRKICVY